MNPDRHKPLRSVTRTQVISAAVSVALITGVLLLADAPVWAAVVAAGVCAALLGIRCWWDHRHGSP